MTYLCKGWKWTMCHFWLCSYYCYWTPNCLNWLSLLIATPDPLIICSTYSKKSRLRCYRVPKALIRPQFDADSVEAWWIWGCRPSLWYARSALRCPMPRWSTPRQPLITSEYAVLASWTLSIWEGYWRWLCSAPAVSLQYIRYLPKAPSAHRSPRSAAASRHC